MTPIVNHVSYENFSNDLCKIFGTKNYANVVQVDNITHTNSDTVTLHQTTNNDKTKDQQ